MIKIMALSLLVSFGAAHTAEEKNTIIVFLEKKDGVSRTALIGSIGEKITIADIVTLLNDEYQYGLNPTDHTVYLMNYSGPMNRYTDQTLNQSISRADFTKLTDQHLNEPSSRVKEILDDTCADTIGFLLE